jgi:hypothetical protein
MIFYPFSKQWLNQPDYYYNYQKYENHQEGIIFYYLPPFQEIANVSWADHVYFFSDTLELVSKVLIPAKQKTMEEPK